MYKNREKGDLIKLDMNMNNYRQFMNIPESLFEGTMNTPFYKVFFAKYIEFKSGPIKLKEPKV